FIVRVVAGDSIVIVNSGAQVHGCTGATGISAFHNVCRHRGTTLCTEPQGQLNGSMQCPYHAWTYGYDGTLVGAPHMDGTPHFRKADFPLKRVRCEVWDGFIWVNPSNDGPTLREQLADLPEKFAPWKIGDLRRGARLEYDIPANWKLILQNFSECLHCPNLHPVLNKLSHYLSGENEPLHPGYMGGRMDLSPGVETMSMDGARSCAYLPSLGPDEKRRVYYYAVFPNLLISAHPDYVMVHTLWPLACDRTKLVCEFLFHPSELAKPGFDTKGILDFWDMTNKQDWFVCELAQQGISSRGYTPGPYSNREELLYAFDQFIVERLKAAGDV
ncbi:MAG: aromatic ring-hydroxylating dioxygenase subunit alpha, partial [Acidobacteria bacterium]